MLLQRILFPRPDQVAVSVAAVQRDFPKADEVDGSCSTRRRNAP